MQQPLLPFLPSPFSLYFIFVRFTKYELRI